MSYIVREIVCEHAPCDVDLNVLWMKARRTIPSLANKYRVVYEEITIFVSKEELDEITGWYHECTKFFGYKEWPSKLENLLLDGLNLDAARRKINQERGC